MKVVQSARMKLKTNYGSEKVAHLYHILRTVSPAAGRYLVAKRRRLICAIYFLTTAGDIVRYYRHRTVISFVSGFSWCYAIDKNLLNSDDRLISFLIYRSAWYLQSVIKLSKYI